MFEGLDSYESAFWVCAVGGTTLFVLKSLMMIVGGIGGELDVDVDGGDIAHDGVEGSDFAFKLLSINAITGFFMAFGWGGLFFYKQAGASAILSVLGGGLIGFATMYATAKLFQSIGLLVSDGSVFNIENTIGETGLVYQEIPAEGRGVIQMTLDGVTREIEATSADGTAIASFKNIEVVAVVNPTTVSVRLKS